MRKLLATALAGLLLVAGAGLAQATTITATAPVSSLSCKIGYTVPASSTPTAVHYYYVYLTGYYDRGTYVNTNDVHRVSYFTLVIKDGNNNNMNVGNTYGWNYFINHVFDSAHSGSHPANTWGDPTSDTSAAPPMTDPTYFNTKVVNAPTGFTYRNNRVSMTITTIISHVDIAVTAAYRVNGLGSQFGQCIATQESPWWNGVNP